MQITLQWYIKCFWFLRDKSFKYTKKTRIFICVSYVIPMRIHIHCVSRVFLELYAD